MKVPADCPEYVEKAVAELETRATAKLRKGDKNDYAAGYYSAVADLKDQLELEADLEAGERKKRLRAITHGDTAA